MVESTLQMLRKPLRVPSVLLHSTLSFQADVLFDQCGHQPLLNQCLDHLVNSLINFARERQLRLVLLLFLAPDCWVHDAVAQNQRLLQDNAVD